MTEIIPAILAYSEKEFDDKVKQIGARASTIQIDVMDGLFVPNRTWADPAAVAKMRLPYTIEAHLMVADPLPAAQAWVAAGAQRIFVHAEAEGWRAAVQAAREEEREGGVAVNPNTPLSAIEEVINELDAVLVMGVNPGWSGQPFERLAIARVAELRSRYPRLRIEVDGGVNESNARELAAAGADGLVAASALFSAKNFEESFKALSRAANS
ncbi:ribulose-phosphate 3-epimerase [Patescibacteria group bacterium]|nr:MAG: ribulose-phosphate 3-epimerase [Patescibacteria group bacterium]